MKYKVVMFQTCAFEVVVEADSRNSASELAWERFDVSRADIIEQESQIEECKEEAEK